MKKTIVTNNTSGFTLLELTIGLAVFALIIMAVMPASGLRDTARVNSASNSIRTIRNAAEAYIADGNATYSGVSVTALKTADHLPNGFSDTGSNPWGGNFSVAANASNASQVDLTVTAVPATAGPKLVTLFTNQADTAAYDSNTKTLSLTF